MKFVVDRIEGDFAVLECVDTKEKKEESLLNLPVVKEGDVLIFKDNLYGVDNKAREERMKIIQEKLNRLKRKN
jgi:hypothetical protein